MRYTCIDWVFILQRILTKRAIGVILESLNYKVKNYKEIQKPTLNDNARKIKYIENVQAITL